MYIVPANSRTISNDTEDIVVKAPKTPIKRKIFVVSLMSMNLKNRKQINKHPMKFTAKVSHDIDPEGDIIRDMPYLKVAPIAPPTATIAN
jgi:hypothetical protein